ncbi:helix-turn-helix transcriptional regulator [Povalibacter sp.]|uniref:helix-turn-helix domain-containing protein n=1 Tax=Povalibacter sp. TaxID=1962978 RepID=UPI002F3FAF75
MPTPTLQNAFGKVLREYRLKTGYSQEGLADAAGCDRTFIGMLERGQRQPTLETLFKLSQALDVAAATLVSRTAAEWKG